MFVTQPEDSGVEENHKLVFGAWGFFFVLNHCWCTWWPAAGVVYRGVSLHSPWCAFAQIKTLWNS